VSTTITTGDGCRIVYRFDGPEGAPILLLSNSLGTDSDMWSPQIEAFSEHFRVLRYDSRGHGGSDAPSGAYSLDRLGRDAIELLDALGIVTVDFCGLSLGGMIGQWLGIYAPDRVRRLVLANTSSYMGPPAGWDTRIASVMAQGMKPLAQASAERWFTAAFRETGTEAIAAIVATLLATDRTGYAGCCAAIRDMDMRRTVRLIERPTLVIGGSLDPSTPPPHSGALVEAIPGARLCMLEAAHLSNVEVPERFTEVATDFLVDGFCPSS
jgi:3-oxoadipate enol-lactonase